jgi:hypothetical protein
MTDTAKTAPLHGAVPYDSATATVGVPIYLADFEEASHELCR